MNDAPPSSSRRLKPRATDERLASARLRLHGCRLPFHLGSGAGPRKFVQFMGVLQSHSRSLSSVACGLSRREETGMRISDACRSSIDSPNAAWGLGALLVATALLNGCARPGEGGDATALDASPPPPSFLPPTARPAQGAPSPASVVASQGDAGSVAPAPTAGPLPGSPVSFAPLVRRIRSSVVSVFTAHIEHVGVQYGFMDPGERVARGLGTGFLINSGGEILTNNHVIQDAGNHRSAARRRAAARCGRRRP